MTDDNPFAPPSGDPQDRPPGAPDWEHPGYQDQWASPYEQRPHSRTIPRSLVAACHTSAVGAWVFVVMFGIFAAALDGDDAFAGFVLLMLLGGVLALAGFVGFVMAVVGLVIAVPLVAVWWGERHERQDDGLAEKSALVHLGVAWLFAGYCLLRILF